MIALCAAATALITAGICVGGGWGTALIVLGLVGNHAWLTVTLVRWWQRASYRARLTLFATTTAYVTGWFVIRVAAGPVAAWVLAMAGIGYAATVGGVLAATGYLATHHAKATQHAIATGKLKEITR
ncbi:hypothetical protein RB614_13365 [Phytohabitans sp. ZYX-F-186]|uniref:Uncharacterized protein n=1 Tax=Phytohabitans maris TaxID=3071409 RepID=A0ABU0ZEV9_9ACTN|nr:hypothetical protein [Phytohabitans sp. ZYX-F-186]MDQ7905513.1 hypothetical protein [Phytohabitans sp. ZYX-F-186]